MYANLWSPGLRQGDIVGPLILPLVARDLSIVGSATSLTQPAPEQEIVQLLVKGEKRNVVVVSHDCEFNEAKRNKLLVARLQDVPRNLGTEERDRLRASNDVEGVLRGNPEAKIAGVDSFLLDALPPWSETEQVVNFATITALPMSMKDDLLASKRAEMAHPVRVLFRNKLAWFFGRSADDVPEESKSPPPRREDAAEPSSG